MSSYRRLQAQLQASRRIALQRQIQLSRLHQLQRIQRQREYYMLRQTEKLRAQQQYQEYRVRRAEQHKIVQMEFVQDRLAREAASREYEARVEVERLARAARDKEMEVQRRIGEEEEIRKAEALAASRRAELQRKEQLKSDMDRENLAILDEQKVQEKLEKELNEIEIKIGTIYDDRQARKRRELEELEQLDKKSFKLKQQMRSSKVQQKALEQSLAQLSKLMI